MLILANHRLEIRQPLIKNVCSVFRPPPACESDERLDRGIVISRDQTSCLVDGLRCQWILGSRAEIHLTGISITDIEPIPSILPHVPYNVRPRGNCLSLQRLEL